jgi:hypothetical protein
VEGRNAKKRTQSIKAEFEAIVRPNPIFLLGFRPKLFIYKIAGTQKAKRISLLVKPKWEAPVYYSKVDLEYNKLVLQIIRKQWLFQHQTRLIPHVWQKAETTP